MIRYSSLLLLLISLCRHAYGQEAPVLAAPDSGAAPVDSLSAAPDTLGRMSTPSLVGTVDHHLAPSRMYAVEDLRWMDFNFLGDILGSHPGVYLRDPNSAGQYAQVNVRGADWRAVAFTANGRSLNDPASGIFNPWMFATEYADRIEVITGPRSFLYGLNASGGTINLVTKNYNSNRPFTKLNYTEGAYGYAYTDGTFSQNISRRINLTLGFDHQATDGRFDNSACDAWIIRGKMRYEFSPRFNVIVAEHYTSTYTEMNGGVDPLRTPTASQFLTTLATIRNSTAYEKITRHDMDLSVVATPFTDTASVSMLTLYYSTNLREFRNEPEAFGTATDAIMADHRSSWMGAYFSQNIDAGAHAFSLGATGEIRQIEGSPALPRLRKTLLSIWGKEEVSPATGLTVAVFGRVDHFLGSTHAGAGADATMRLADGLSVYGGTSFSPRLPTYEEVYWSGDPVSRTGNILTEHHHQIEAGVRLHLGEEGYLSMSYFHRTVKNPIIITPVDPTASFPSLQFSSGPALTTDGIEMQMSFRIWHLLFEGVGNIMKQTLGGSRTLSFPEAWGTGGVYVRERLLDDNLELKTGIRGRFRTRHDGEVFNQEVLAYVPNTVTPLVLGSTADFVLEAHIGDAYIHFNWENLLDNQFHSTAFYPVRERAVRFGLSWEFLN